MGVEYSHGIYVKDLHWRPTWRHVEAVRAVLVRWGFVPQDPELYSLSDAAEELDAGELPDALPDNLMAVYEGLEGDAVTRVMGRSQYPDISDDDRYIQTVIVVFGVDYKIVNSETISAELIEPPRNGTAAVARSDTRDQYSHFCTVYPATWATTPPRTRTKTAFSGVWRSGITIDCGKDVPAIADTHPLPSALVRELEQALGTAVVEQGWIY